MKTVYVFYRKEMPNAPYTPVFYNGVLSAYDSYKAAFDECDLEKEVIVKARLIMPDKISNTHARRLTLKQYKILNLEEK